MPRSPGQLVQPTEAEAVGIGWGLALMFLPNSPGESDINQKLRTTVKQQLSLDIFC